jgi:16S rRNA processing protein RimM
VTSAADEPSRGSDRSATVSAGRVGRSHGLDGSFYVTGARPRLLELGSAISVNGRTVRVTRRAGTDEHPIVRVQGIEDRGSAEAVRGLELTVELAQAPALGEGEWWAGELEGCEVVDGERRVGVVAGLLELPSCEALEVRLFAPRSGLGGGPGGRSGGETVDGPDGVTGDAPDLGRRDELLVPMVKEAIRHVDVSRRRIDVDMSFLEDVP